MAINNPYNTYFENQLKTATPGKLLVMLYDAAIRFAKTASMSMQEGNLYEQSESIRKVQNVLLELLSSLDTKADPQLAANLQSLYEFMFDQLTDANIHDNQSALTTVIDLLTEMRGVWSEAETLIRSGRGSSKLEAKAA